MVTAIRQAAVSALEPGQDRSRPPSRVAHSRTGERVKASHPNQAAHGCGGSDPAPEQVRRQLVADLLHALPGVSGHIAAALDAVLLLACASCPSCVAVSLTVDHETQPVTITATRSAGHRDAASRTVRLPRPTTGEPARQPAVLVVFATDPVALAGLCDDVTALLEIDPGRITLAAAAAVPQKTVVGLVLAGQLADRAAVDQALGALLEQGWVPPEARRELRRRADDAGATLAHAAGTVLAALPGVPEQRM